MDTIQLRPSGIRYVDDMRRTEFCSSCRDGMKKFYIVSYVNEIEGQERIMIEAPTCSKCFKKLKKRVKLNHIKIVYYKQKAKHYKQTF